jgi:hypothetical protein
MIFRTLGALRIKKSKKWRLKNYIGESACADQSTSTENWEQLMMN